MLRFEREGSGEANDAWISRTVGDPGPKRPDPLQLSFRRKLLRDDLSHRHSREGGNPCLSVSWKHRETFGLLRRLYRVGDVTR